MNHPNAEELTGFLYDELEPARVEEIRAHMAACAECRSRVTAWRGVRRELATWELPDEVRGHPPVEPGRRLLQPILKWAVAAAVLMGSGFAVARMSEKPLDTSKLRAQLAGEIRSELRREVAAAQAQFASNQAARNEVFEQAVVRAIGELEARQIVAHASLRKDVETLAVRAQQGFDQIAYTGQFDEKQKAPQQQ